MILYHMDLREYIQRTRLHKDRTGGDVPFTHLTVEVSVFIFYLFIIYHGSYIRKSDSRSRTEHRLAALAHSLPRAAVSARRARADSRDPRDSCDDSREGFAGR